MLFVFHLPRLLLALLQLRRRSSRPPGGSENEQISPTVALEKVHPTSRTKSKLPFDPPALVGDRAGARSCDYDAVKHVHPYGANP